MKAVSSLLSPIITNIALLWSEEISHGFSVHLCCVGATEPRMLLCQFFILSFCFLKFIPPPDQWVCVLADGNRWNGQPRRRGSPGSSSAGEWYHPPRLVFHFYLPSSLPLRPALSSFAVPHIKSNLPQSNLLCAAQCRACKCLPFPNLTSRHVWRMLYFHSLAGVYKVAVALLFIS